LTTISHRSQPCFILSGDGIFRPLFAGLKCAFHLGKMKNSEKRYFFIFRASGAEGSAFNSRQAHHLFSLHSRRSA